MSTFKQPTKLDSWASNNNLDLCWPSLKMELASIFWDSRLVQIWFLINKNDYFFQQMPVNIFLCLLLKYYNFGTIINYPRLHAWRVQYLVCLCVCVFVTTKLVFNIKIQTSYKSEFLQTDRKVGSLKGRYLLTGKGGLYCVQIWK